MTSTIDWNNPNTIEFFKRYIYGLVDCTPPGAPKVMRDLLGYETIDYRQLEASHARPKRPLIRHPKLLLWS